MRMKMFRMAIPQAVSFTALGVEEAGRSLIPVFLPPDEAAIVFAESIVDLRRLFESGHPFMNNNLRQYSLQDLSGENTRRR